MGYTSNFVRSVSFRIHKCSACPFCFCFYVERKSL